MVFVDWYHCTKNLSAFAGKACCMGLQQNKILPKRWHVCCAPTKMFPMVFLKPHFNIPIKYTTIYVLFLDKNHNNKLYHETHIFSKYTTFVVRCLKAIWYSILFFQSGLKLITEPEKRQCLTTNLCQNYSLKRKYLYCLVMDPSQNVWRSR